MNAGTLRGFTYIGLGPGQSYPELGYKHLPVSSYTLSAWDRDWVLCFDWPTAVSVSLGQQTNTMKRGQCIHIAQWGAGQVTVTAQAGLVLRASLTTKTARQWAVITLAKAYLDNELSWHCFGDMAAS